MTSRPEDDVGSRMGDDMPKNVEFCGSSELDDIKNLIKEWISFTKGSYEVVCIWLLGVYQALFSHL